MEEEVDDAAADEPVAELVDPELDKEEEGEREEVGRSPSGVVAGVWLEGSVVDAPSEGVVEASLDAALLDDAVFEAVEVGAV